MKYRHRVLSLLSLLSVVTYLDRVCISVAGPRMQEALHIGPVGWGWVTGIFMLSYAVFEIPSGALGDRIGPRRILTLIVLWWSAFTTLTGLVTSYPILLATRFCFGMGEAGAYPNASIAIARWFPLQKRAGAWGFVLMASQIGGAIAPLLVVPIQMRYGWRAAFFLFGVAGVAWGILWYSWFRDSPAEMPGVSEAELAEIGPATKPLHGLPWGEALRSANFWYLLGIGACYVYTLTFFQSWLPTYLVKAKGFTETGLLLASLPFFVGAFANAFGGMSSDAMVRKLGLRPGRRFIGVAGLGGTALFLTAAALTPQRLPALIFLALANGAITFAQPGAMALCLDIGGKYGGAVTGSLNTAGYLAGFLASLVFGYMVDGFKSYNAPFIPMVAMLLAGVLITIAIDPSQQLARSNSPAIPAVSR